MVEREVSAFHCAVGPSSVNFLSRAQRVEVALRSHLIRFPVYSTDS